MEERNRKKWYAVRRGRVTGVYDNWKECEAQIKGYPGPSFRKFYDERQALDFANGVQKR